MTTDKKITIISSMLDYDVDDSVVSAYLDLADDIILNRLFPFGERPIDAVPSIYVQNEL